MRSVVRVYLMGRDFEFVFAEDGERAMDLLRDASFDLVVADINMPKLDGIAFTRQLRESSLAAKTVPIVLLSGDKSRRTEALAAGANAFLAKPLKRDELMDIVGELLPKSTK